MYTTNNIIFFSGPHGVGKSTTISEFIKSMDCKAILFEEHTGNGDHGNPYRDKTYHRQTWRLTKYYLDMLDLIDKAIEIFPRILLVDRCYLDLISYTKAFTRLNWITDEQDRKIRAHCGLYFHNLKYQVQNVVYLNPPYKWNVDRIKHRWNEEKVKWNEGDFAYLEILRNEYNCTMDNRGVLEIHETDLEKRISMLIEYYNSFEENLIRPNLAI